MDQYRQIRFLIPPFFFLGALFLADFTSCKTISEAIIGLKGEAILAISAGLGASTIPLGFFIGAVSVACLNFIWLICSGKSYSDRKREANVRNWCSWICKFDRTKWEFLSYEAGISDEACKNIWGQLDIKPGYIFDFRKRFYLAATFDHGVLPKGINEWLMRRWNAFNTNINCIVALGLSKILVHYLPQIQSTQAWRNITWGIMAALFFNAIIAWKQTMRMVEFQATRDVKKSMASQGDKK